MDYTRKQPCDNCPYRTDAPLKHWAKEEFINLMQKDKDYFGATFGCHKKDDHVCVGWLIDQDKRNLPSIQLRLSLSQNNVTIAYLDSLFCKVPLFKSIKDMVKANYPDLLRK